MPKLKTKKKSRSGAVVNVSQLFSSAVSQQAQNKEIANRLVRLMQLIESPYNKGEAISQKEFAEEIGISASALNQIIKNYTGIAISSLVKICIAFNVNAQWILMGEGDIFINFARNKSFKHN